MKVNKEQTGLHVLLYPYYVVSENHRNHFMIVGSIQVMMKIPQHISPLWNFQKKVGCKSNLKGHISG